MGLSLRYKVSEHSIRFANDIPTSGNIAYLIGRDILIPQGAPSGPAPATEDGARRALVRAFCSATGLSDGEARYYLGESEWDLKRAQALLRADEEKEAGGGGAGSGPAPPGAAGASAGGGSRARVPSWIEAATSAATTATSALLRQSRSAPHDSGSEEEPAETAVHTLAEGAVRHRRR
jgi:hypothetical protein